MRAQLFKRVILTRDMPEQGLRKGDVGTVVEVYDDPAGNAIGYEIETFAANGETLAVESVPVDAVRRATATDHLASRVG
jgi:hypothetical protein